MQQPTLSASSIRAPSRRALYKLRAKFCGYNAYFAATSDRRILHGAIFLGTPENPDEEIVVWLRRELDRVDPVQPRHLQLLPRTVSPAIDGPSPSHPAMKAAEPDVDVGEQLRDLLATIARERSANPPPAPTTIIEPPDPQYSTEALIARLSARVSESA